IEGNAKQPLQFLHTQWRIANIAADPPLVPVLNNSLLVAGHIDLVTPYRRRQPVQLVCPAGWPIEGENKVSGQLECRGTFALKGGFLECCKKFGFCLVLVFFAQGKRCTGGKEDDEKKAHAANCK